MISVCCFFFFFKQKTAYEMRISDWSSDVCSSDLSRAVTEISDQPRLTAAQRVDARVGFAEVQAEGAGHPFQYAVEHWRGGADGLADERLERAAAQPETEAEDVDLDVQILGERLRGSGDQTAAPDRLDRAVGDLVAREVDGFFGKVGEGKFGPRLEIGRAHV